MTGLVKLNLARNGLTDEDLTFLEVMTQLIDLDLTANWELTSIAYLAGLTKIEVLNLTSTKVTNLSALYGKKYLAKLVMINMGAKRANMINFSALQESEQLRLLDVRENGLRDDWGQNWRDCLPYTFSSRKAKSLFLLRSSPRDHQLKINW